jgi:2-oxoglutarate dehydrogenase E2 component (dihydrolipoamide succinyltransferase)
MADGEPEGEAHSGKGGTAKGESQRLELGRRAQAAARRLAESKATIPHGYAGRRVRLGGEAPPLPTVIGALARALRARPELNATYRDGGIECFSRINVAITVETDDGPLMPTLFDADEMGVEEIADRIEELGAGARGGELTSPQLSGATITVGSEDDGADYLACTITPGQTAHLGVGRVREEADGRLVDLNLSFDQRAVRPPAAAALLGLMADALAEADPGGG